MPVDTFQLKSVAIKCLQGCWGPRHEKINGVSNSKITHFAVLISVSVMIARKYKYLELKSFLDMHKIQDSRTCGQI